MKRLVLLAAILSVATVSAALIPSGLVLENYEQVLDFTRLEHVRIIDDDKDEFSDPAYDDSSWRVISLPVNSNDIFPEHPDVCWYRLHVRFPQDLPDSALGISLGIISDTDQTWFNGKLIGRMGSEQPEHVSAYDKKRIYELPAKLIRPGADNVIALRVKGYLRDENGPFKGSFIIAPLAYLQKKFVSREFIDIAFVAIYLIVALYFLFIFAARSIDREYLFFALFVLVSAVYMFLQTQVKYIFFEDFLALKRVEYIALFLIPLLVMEYITHFFSKKRTLFHYTYMAVAAIAAGLVIFSPEIKYWRSALLYVIEPLWLVPIGYCLLISFRGMKKDPNAKYLLVSFVIMWLIFINDALVDRNLIGSMRFSTYAFMVVIVGSAVIMVNHYRQLYSAADEFTTRRRGKTSVSDENRRKVDEAVAYIKENYISEISREGLASLAGMHYDYFGKIFRQATGMKINDYINLLRINEAARRLVETDQKVIDIAFAVGFESLSTFYRVFQQVKGVSPTEWQENGKGAVTSA